ncbi:MAG: aldehyde dehydrogenase, partial [Ktedonobacterales bacterium]|nr:aldehyde dehydrogenase [Ktedonobacterales bacterium]
MDRAIARLQEQKQAWADLPVTRKIAYLEAMRGHIDRAAARWVAAAVEAKGIPAHSPLAGEEWLSGPWALLFGVNRYIETLRAVAKTGYPDLPANRVHTRPDGQVVVDVFPGSTYDKLLLSGVTGQVWMQPGVTKDNLRDTMAVWYRTPNPVGKVALVLGAGNIASIAPLDVLYKLIAEGQVCLLKMNPVNDYLGPFMEEVFGDLVTDGFVQLAYGGVNGGVYLTNHPGIDEIHITGSASTHDAIVFGTGPEGAERKRTSQPANTRRVTSELGNVSPTIVVPGPWTKADLRFQAENILTQKMHNGGFNCIAAQVLVMPDSWEHTDDLISALQAAIRATPARISYYPGADKRQAATLVAHPDAQILDAPAPNVVPRTLVLNVPPEQVNDMCFKVEAFDSVLSETRLPGADAATFLRNAVAFCNDTLWGTLGANILIHPTTMKQLGAAWDQALADLRYGCIAINGWTGMGFLMAQTTWGAYPGHTLNDIQSGVGVVHNSFLFDRPQKSVVQAPFYPYPRSFAHGLFTVLPKPPWFVTNKTAASTGRLLVHFEASPSAAKLPG